MADAHEPRPGGNGDSSGAGARKHLSIGEVLGALQDEYPDITISKIRFLESQGLLNPERTPSGYRKFYPHDVEQLRWVLRQQKENFLPLKVIKDRLAAGQVDLPPEASGLLDLASAAEGGNHQGDAATSATSAVPARSGGAAAQHNAAPTPPSVASQPATRPASGAKPNASSDDAAGDADAEASSGAGRSTDAGDVTSPPTGGEAGSRARKARPPRAGSPNARLGAAGSSVSLTASDLCAAADIPPRFLADLERFGLVAPISSDGPVVYDEEALATARLAGALGAFGVEPRHLRMYRVAAEREAGLYEQLISARLQTRRPESRAEALADLARINDLAGQFREVQLRSALGEAFPLD